MKKQLKTPSDYPQFSFRVSKKDKEAIDEMLLKLTKKAEKERKDGEALVRRNYFVAEALKIGLKKLIARED